MPDQADKLRQLVVAAEPDVRECAGLPPTIVVTGGKGGVGATTVAINLAAALAQNGRRSVLVDTAPHADAAQLLGIDVERGGTLEDVLAGTVSAADALVAGPAGISLLANRWAAERSLDRSPKSLERLLDVLPSLAEHADVLVVDSGSGGTSWTRELWQRADLVLLVTTADDVAVMDSYATIKRAAMDSNEDVDIRVLVNQCNDTATAVDVQSRLSAACRRFLGLSIARAPLLPRHAGASRAGIDPPMCWEEFLSPLARSVQQLGRFAIDVLSRKQRSETARYELSKC